MMKSRRNGGNDADGAEEGAVFADGGKGKQGGGKAKKDKGNKGGGGKEEGVGGGGGGRAVEPIGLYEGGGFVGPGGEDGEGWRNGRKGCWMDTSSRRLDCQNTWPVEGLLGTMVDSTPACCRCELQASPQASPVSIQYYPII
jgi:hypothetical protein